MIRALSPFLRQSLTGISLFGLLAWAHLLPAAPQMAVDTATAATSASTARPTATATMTRTNTPTLDPSDPRISINNILTTLRSTGAITIGGRLLFSVQDGYAITNSMGENFLPLGGEQNAQDFVLGVQMGWYVAGSGSACGVSFREGPADWWSVLVTSDGRLIVARQSGTTRIIDADVSIPSFNAKPYKNALWLAASGSNLAVYYNGQLQATIIDSIITRGGFALDVYNVSNNAVITDCRYRNLWVWSYDNAPATNTPTITATRRQP